MKSLSTLLYEYAFSTDGNRLKRPSIEMTIEEFCDENNIDLENINDAQVSFFYYDKAQYAHTSNAHEKYLASIRESLTSYSGKKLAEKISKVIGEHGIVDSSESDTPQTIYVFLNDNYLVHSKSIIDFTLSDTKESDDIYKLLKQFNYHITKIDYFRGSCIIVIEPRYSKDMTEYWRKRTDVFYHITHKDNLKKIFKRGLTPKVGKTRIQGGYRYFPEKVFLLADSEYAKSNIEEIIRNKQLSDEDYAILKIDLKGHNIGLYKDDFYNDEEFVYTYEAIPPELLTIVELEDLK